MRKVNTDPAVFAKRMEHFKELIVSACGPDEVKALRAAMGLYVQAWDAAMDREALESFSK